MDAGLSGEVRWWLHNVQDWPCLCRNSHACDRCWIRDSLAATAAHLTRRSWAAAHRAASRAAGIDSRLEALRDRLGLLASVLEGEGRMADPTVRYSCGRTYLEHREALRDVILRAEIFTTDGQLHEDDDAAGIHVHQQQVTCRGCHSSFSFALPGDDGVVEVSA